MGATDDNTTEETPSTTPNMAIFDADAPRTRYSTAGDPNAPPWLPTASPQDVTANSTVPTTIITDPVTRLRRQPHHRP